MAFAVGCTLGFIAGLRGGWLDQVISRCNDIVMAIPTLILALIVLAVLPKTIPVLTLVLGLLESTRVLRVARSLAVDIGVMEFVDVARLRGESLGWILWHVILPNARYRRWIADSASFYLYFAVPVGAVFPRIRHSATDRRLGRVARDNKDGILLASGRRWCPAARLPCWRGGERRGGLADERNHRGGRKG